jgi:3-keto-disaccharide hydrolase
MKRLILVWWCAVALTAAAAAAPAAKAPAQKARTTAAAGAWRSLFDGKSLDAWRTYKSEAPPEKWVIADGVLSKDGNASDLVSKEEFGDFEVQFDWRIGEAGNSGFFYRGSEDEEAIYWTGPEYQLLDDIKARDNKTRNHCAGSVYDLYDAPEGHLKPVGEWNVTRIVAKGAHVEHWLNGFKMVEYELWSPDWEQHLAASKFKAWPKYGRIKKGHFGIQGNHPGALALRNIRVRDLQ